MADGEGLGPTEPRVPRQPSVMAKYGPYDPGSSLPRTVHRVPCVPSIGVHRPNCRHSNTHQAGNFPIVNNLAMHLTNHKARPGLYGPPTLPSMNPTHTPTSM